MLLPPCLSACGLRAGNAAVFRISISASMRKLASLYLLSLPLFVCGQAKEQAKYEIISFLLERYLPTLHTGYFKFEKPKDPSNFNKIDSIMMVIDPRTGVTDTITRIDSLLSRQITFYQKEIRLWNQRERLGKKVIFIGGVNWNVDWNRVQPNEYPGYALLVKRLHVPDSVQWQVANISANIPDYVLRNDTPVKDELDEYAAAGYVWFSDVVLNEQQTKAVVFLAFHYQIKEDRGDRGPTGAGGLLCLVKENGQWKIDKSRGLWEE